MAAVGLSALPARWPDTHVQGGADMAPPVPPAERFPAGLLARLPAPGRTGSACRAAGCGCMLPGQRAACAMPTSREALYRASRSALMLIRLVCPALLKLFGWFALLARGDAYAADSCWPASS